MRVRMIDNVTGKVVRVAKQFSKAIANAPKAAVTVAKTGTIAQKVAMGIATTGLVAGGATGIVLNIPKQAPAPEQKPAITQPTKTEETKTEDTKSAEETKTEDNKPAEETKTEDNKPAEETKAEDNKPTEESKTEDNKSAVPVGHYESVQKSKYVEDGTYTVVTLTDDDGDPITFTTSFGTSSDAQFSTQAEAEAYLNSQHQALTQRTGRKSVLPGNTGRGFNVGETQTKGHTEYWTEQVWVSGN